MTDKAKQLIEIAQQLLTLAVAEMTKDAVVSVPAAVAPKPIVTKPKPKVPTANALYDLNDKVQIVDYTHDMYGETYKINCVYWNDMNDLWVYRGDLGTFYASQLKLVQRAGVK